MRLLVCFKVVADIELLSDDDWKAENGAVDVSFVKSILNCFDESALEMTLKLSDLSEGFQVICNLNAFTIGDRRCNPFLKTLYALRYEKAVRVECSEDIRFVPEKIAAIVANYVQNKNNQDVIIMGSQSSEGDNGKTPLITAELLGWPCITQVIEITSVSEQELRVVSASDSGIVTQVIQTPCVLSVGNAPNSYIRVPTLKDRMKSSKKEIEVYKVEDFYCDTQKTADSVLEELSEVYTGRIGVIIEGESPFEKAEKLYQLYLKGRLEKK